MQLDRLVDDGNERIAAHKAHLSEWRRIAFNHLADVIGQVAANEIDRGLIKRENYVDDGDDLKKFIFDVFYAPIGEFGLTATLIGSVDVRSDYVCQWFLTKDEAWIEIRNAGEFAENLARIAAHNKDPKWVPLQFRKSVS